MGLCHRFSFFVDFVSPAGLYDEHPDFMDYYERFIGAWKRGLVEKGRESGKPPADDVENDVCFFHVLNVGSF